MSTVVSIIICTRDRAESLRETLASVASCDVPPDLAAELLVIDNGSTDSTARVVREASGCRIRIRYVSEPRRGQDYAYNTGMADAEGSIYLFTDDDVRVPRDWIVRMCRPIHAREADATCGGVRPAPHLRRRWLLEGFPAFAACNEGALHPLMVGANMAFSRDVLRHVPVFDEKLGPGALGFGGESLFTRQLLRCGCRLRRVADADVEHHFTPDRLDARHVLDTARKMGRSDAYIFYHWEHGTPWTWSWGEHLRFAAAMVWRRLFRHAEWAESHVPPYWLIPLVMMSAFWVQYARECLTPRRY